MKMKMKLKMENISHKCYINRRRPRHGHEHTKYKMSQYNDGYMY